MFLRNWESCSACIGPRRGDRSARMPGSPFALAEVWSVVWSASVVVAGLLGSPHSVFLASGSGFFSAGFVSLGSAGMAWFLVAGMAGLIPWHPFPQGLPPKRLASTWMFGSPRIGLTCLARWHLGATLLQGAGSLIILWCTWRPRASQVAHRS